MPIIEKISDNKLEKKQSPFEIPTQSTLALENDYNAKFTTGKKLWQNQATTHDITVDNDYTLTSDQNEYGRIIITDTGVLLTTTRNINVGTEERSFIVQNDTAQSLVIKTLAGTGATLTTGSVGFFICDGTNVVGYSLSAL